MGGGDALSSEKSRICPSCRMEISVLAVKCRFCGEEVGKPKEEQRTLSINDLGGEAIHHRAPSGSVMEALEAFRVESDLEIKKSEEDSAGDGESAQVGSDGMPVLESDLFDTDFGSGRKSAITSVYTVKPPTLQERIKTIGLIVGGIVVLAFLGVQAPGWIDKYRAADADAVVSTYINRAPGIMQAGGPPIEVLVAAIEAIDHEDGADNRRIANDALAAVVGRVRSLLNEAPFKEANLRDASSLAAQARDIYGDEQILRVVEEVTADSIAYRMTLISIDRETKTASFQPNLPGTDVISVVKGDLLAERFFVRLVGSRSVILEDKLRGNRVVKFERGGIAD